MVLITTVYVINHVCLAHGDIAINSSSVSQHLFSNLFSRENWEVEIYIKWTISQFSFVLQICPNSSFYDLGLSCLEVAILRLKAFTYINVRSIFFKYFILWLQELTYINVRSIFFKHFILWLKAFTYIMLEVDF